MCLINPSFASTLPFTTVDYRFSTLLNIIWKVLVLSFQSYMQSHSSSPPNASSPSLAWFSYFHLIYKHLYVDQRMEATNGSKPYLRYGRYFCIEFAENKTDLEIQEIKRVINCEQRFTISNSELVGRFANRICTYGKNFQILIL